MSVFEYPVTIFRQQSKAPLQVAFVARAADVLKWGGIPRKSDELLTGYQRFRDTERIDREIVPFFQDPSNCSPTAIIVALRKDSGLGTTKITCSVADFDELSAEDLLQGVQGVLTITVDDDALETDAVFSAALGYVTERLASDDENGDDENGDDEEDDLEATDDGIIEDTGGENGDDAEGGSDDADFEDGFHLGTTTLHKLQSLLIDKQNWANTDFRASIADYVKPAFVIDGQHRITAGAKFGKGLPFLICGLFDASWPEQVFQFTVVNLKPKRIPPALITSIAALSLSRGEQEQVSTRLQSAGVKMLEVDVMSLVAYDDESPFCDLVAMAVGSRKSESDRLGYGSMKRIAMVWHRANRSSLTIIAKQLYDTNSQRKARDQWREKRIWYYFFRKFWDTVKQHYADHLWAKSPNSRLFIGSHLWALQDVVLGAADGQMHSAWKVPDVKATYEERLQFLEERFVEVVSTTIKYFPEAVWTTEWAKASQDTTTGRAELVELFTRFVDEGKKRGQWKTWRNDPWFKKKKATTKD
jgi:hypothetical protein